MKPRSAFTLIEVLVTLAVVATLSVATVVVLNPSEVLRQSRDSSRISGLKTLSSALDFYGSSGGGSFGSGSIVYVSLPDPLATSTAGDQCQGLGLTALPLGYTYQCAASSTFQKVDGTGWIPLNFKAITGGTPIEKLPVDPVNQSSSHLYYTFVGSGLNHELTSPMESIKYGYKGPNDVVSTDGGRNPHLFEKGTFFLEPLDYAFRQPFGTYFFQFGTSGAGDGQFDGPEGISLDPSGNVFVADWGNGRVQKFSSDGNFLSKTVLADAGVPGKPDGITIDQSGNLYVADYPNSHIDKFDPSGNYLLQFGGFNNPEGIEVDPTGAYIYVPDWTYSKHVNKFDSNGNYLSQFGSNGSGDGQFASGPDDVAVDASGNVYANDGLDHRIEKFNSNGTYLSQISLPNNGSAYGIAIDISGNIYVSDTTFCTINKFDSNGTYIDRFGSCGSGNGQFRIPTYLVTDTAGNLYVVDQVNNRVQVFSTGN